MNLFKHTVLLLLLLMLLIISIFIQSAYTLQSGQAKSMRQADIIATLRAIQDNTWLHSSCRRPLQNITQQISH